MKNEEWKRSVDKEKVGNRRRWTRGRCRRGAIRRKENEVVDGKMRSDK